MIFIEYQKGDFTVRTPLMTRDISLLRDALDVLDPIDDENVNRKEHFLSIFNAELAK